MATLLQFKELASPCRLRSLLGTPVSDMTKTGGSCFAHAKIDHGLGCYERFLADAFALDAGVVELRPSSILGTMTGTHC